MVADSPWMKVKPDAVAYAQVSESTLLREIRAGRLRAVFVGGRRAIRIKREWIDAWLLQQSPDHIAAPTPEQRPLRMVRS